jgi:hypothetical protein
MKELEKIHQLLASEQIENVKLGLSLIESQGIDFRPYQQLVDWYYQYDRSSGSFEVDIARLFGKEKIWLKMKEVEELPQELTLLPKLKRLSCHRNKLKNLPTHIGQLEQLEVLDLYCNQIEELPEDIGALKNLKRLDLYDNQLTELPESIGDLVNLEDLNIASNPIKDLPETIGELRNLRVFKLHATPISASVRVALREKLPKGCKLIY